MNFAEVQEAGCGRPMVRTVIRIDSTTATAWLATRLTWTYCQAAAVSERFVLKTGVMISHLREGPTLASLRRVLGYGDSVALFFNH